ncbi:c-type cytochrome [Methylomagnum sp.]
MNKTTYLIGGLLLVMFGTAALAEPSSKVAWTTETLAFVKSGDAAKGKQLAETCAACHGTGPQPTGSDFPYLQGQLAAYLYKQLSDYKSGTRANAVMAGLAAGLSEKDMADIAAWYSQQEIPAGKKEAGATDSAEVLVENGDGKRILPPCQACHEPGGQGQKVDVPALAGQNPVYTEQTLKDYKSGARKNDLYGRMRTITQQLSDEEIQQLARYYSGLN